MLHVQNITKSFGGVQAIRGSTFELRANEVTALIGPNGAGKTTLFDSISGFTDPDTGAVIFNGTDITRHEPFERARAGISRTFQQVRLFRYLTIADHLRMVDHTADEKLLCSLVRRSVNDRAEHEAILARYGLAKPPDTLIVELSYGQRKLLQIALAVERPHTLLLLDEPVAGVNSVVQEQIEKLLLALKARGETMLLIDHDMHFIRTLADRVIVLDAGVVIADGQPQAVLENPQVLEAYLGS